MKKTNVGDAFKLLKPEGCIFVISRDKKGKPNGMVASWYMKCSEEPPLIAVSLWNLGNTHKLIRESKEFIVAVANKGLEKELMYFGSRSGRTVEKFKETKIKTEKAKHVNLPLIKDATFNFECKLEKEVKVGECVMFIGRILESYHNPKKKVLMCMSSKNKKRVFKEF
jgi:flavin reductase (DIM6/NTAB) family NADH-FMN oxidoreductase RutF